MAIDLQGIETALWAAAAALLPEAALERRALIAAIEARSRRYTSEREQLGVALTGLPAARDLAARALFFGLADAAKMALPVAELAARGALPATEPLAVLDVGAGALAMTLGLAAALPERRLAVTACDSDGAALELGSHAARCLGLTVSSRTIDATRTLPAGSFDLVLAGTVLNELPAAARLELGRAMLARTTATGAVIIIEPALRDTSRALHALRDALIGEGAHVVAPCTRALAPCPALADARDWCHEDRPWRLPERLGQLAQSTGLRDGGLKFSYLVLRRDPPRPFAARALRVVSDDVSGKGQVARVVCSDEGRAPLVLRRREAAEDRLVLRRARRGDVLYLDGAGHLRRNDDDDDDDDLS
jgi:ribosomal protein RSM22 (predicted rRNA methylase)